MVGGTVWPDVTFCFFFSGFGVCSQNRKLPSVSKMSLMRFVSISSSSSTHSSILSWSAPISVATVSSTNASSFVRRMKDEFTGTRSSAIRLIVAWLLSSAAKSARLSSEVAPRSLERVRRKENFWPCSRRTSADTSSRSAISSISPRKTPPAIAFFARSGTLSSSPCRSHSGFAGTL